MPFEEERKMTDEELVASFRSGNRVAIDEMLRRYRGYVKAKARSFFLVGSEVEDLVQEGMIGLYNAVCDYCADKNCSFKSFAYLCISRQIYTAIKSANREKHRVLSNSISLSAPIGKDGEENIYIDVVDETEGSNPEDAIISREMRETVTKSVNRVLSTDEKSILKLYLYGLKYSEIADKLGMREKSIDNALQRIRKKLQKDICR